MHVVSTAFEGGVDFGLENDEGGGNEYSDRQ